MALSKLTSEDIVWRQQLLEEQFKCDTALEIDSFKIGVHWLILCEHSDVFKAMYRSTCKESQPGHNIKLGFPIDAALLSTIVQYFYTHEITLSPQNCFECIGFAHMYQIQHLLKIAKKFFLDEIDLCDQPAHVLTDMNFYFREEQVSRMERRFILRSAAPPSTLNAVDGTSRGSKSQCVGPGLSPLSVRPAVQRRNKLV